MPCSHNKRIGGPCCRSVFSGGAAASYTDEGVIVLLQVKLEGIKKVVCSEVPELPAPEPGWAVLKTGAVGICGSEMHVYLGENPVLSPPRVQGHEFSGTVKALNGDSQIKVGDRVTVNPVVACGECFHCKGGHRYLCDSAYVIGGEVAGALGGEVKAPIRNLVPIADGTSMVDATLIEPTAVAVHTVGKLADSTVLIIGQGAIGLLCLQVAKKNGNRVIVMDVSDEMLAIARRLGCDGTINSRREDAASVLGQLLGGQPLDAVIDAVCAPVTVDFSIRNVKKGGLIIWVGIPKKAFEYDLVTFLCKEIRLHTSYLYSEEDFLRAKELVEDGSIAAKEMVSRVFPVAQSPQAFAYKLDTPCVKVVIANE